MNEELRKMMSENPNLPVVFCCGTDELEDYYLTFYENFRCELVRIYKTDERVFDSIIDVTEYYQEIYETDEEVERAIEATEQYDAILVICR